MFAVIRALTYATIFVGLVLVLVPARLLESSGVTPSRETGLPQFAGAMVVLLGAALALWCVLAFAVIGRGTPAPFDPPRRLVVAGPYRFVRNPMYLGAALVLAGLTTYFASLRVFGYTLLFLVVTHLFVIWYEEPTLRRLFGNEYEQYCSQVHRWRPSRRPTIHQPLTTNR